MQINRLLKERKQDIIYHEGDERWCSIQGRKLWKPSVTTFIGSVLNKGIGYDMWLGNSISYKEACKERDIAAQRGTLVHNLCEELIIKGSLDVSEEIISDYGDEVLKRLMSFQDWFINIKPKIITTEYKLYHPDVPYSGTPDIICEIDGKVCLVDIKTGAPYPSHQLQLTCYKTLWDTIFPEYPIAELYGLYLKDNWITKVAPNFKKYKYNSDAVDSVFQVWQWQNGGKAWPKDKPLIPTSFRLSQQSDENL